MDNFTHYDDVVAEVVLCAARRDAAVAAGINPDRIVLNEALGLRKLASHNWELLVRPFPGLERAQSASTYRCFA